MKKLANLKSLSVVDLKTVFGGEDLQSAESAPKSKTPVVKYECTNLSITWVAKASV